MWAVRGPTRLASRLDFGRLSLLAPAHGGSKPPARRPVDATTIGRAAATAAQPSDAADAPVVPHVSVMLNEVLEAFRPVKVNVYVDGTLGAGGHAVAVLAAHRELHTLVGIDLDPTAREIASRRLQAAARPGVNVHLVAGNYSEVAAILARLPPPAAAANGAGQPPPPQRHSPEAAVSADAILMDLGVSSMQLDSPERGFSYHRDGPIDMRMDPTSGSSAEEILNTWSEVELGRIIRDYGEEKMWRAVARRLVQAREAAPLRSTRQVADAIGNVTLVGPRPKKGAKYLHPATRTFQALRIAVNDELRQLEAALPAAVDCLAPGGRLAVISFHSLEDRAVKHAFLRAAGRPTPEEEHLTRSLEGAVVLEQMRAARKGDIVTRKPLEPSDAEVAANPRSRSAKLRVFERRAA